jgi:hypothetical protein
MQEQPPIGEFGKKTMLLMAGDKSCELQSSLAAWIRIVEPCFQVKRALTLCLDV